MARVIAALSAGLLLATAGFAAQAQAPAGAAAADAMTDPAMKRTEVVAFIGLKPGDRVADIVAGRFVRALSVAVRPKGKVYAAPINAPALPGKLDAVFIRQDYHDLHDKFMGPADVAGFNRAVFAALKPGGVYVVLDHAAAPGSGLRDTDTLHRIDPAAVKAEVTAAGFVLDGESPILANPADDHSKFVFDPAVRGHTDQFLFRFRKPK